jgi:hypothetical protein
MLRNQYATLGNKQRKPSFNGTSEEFGSVSVALEQSRPTGGKPKPHAKLSDP